MSQVILYTTPACPWCVKTKEFLKQHKVVFVEIDVLEDRTAYDRVVNHTDQLSVPVIETGEAWIVGFQPEEILRATKVAQSSSSPQASSSQFVKSTVKAKRARPKIKKDPITKANPSKIPAWKKK